MAMIVLVVEDDAGIAAGLHANFQKRGYVVDVCGTLDSAWSRPCPASPSTWCCSIWACPTAKATTWCGGSGSLPDSLMQVLIMTAAPSGQPHQGAEPWGP